MNKRSFLTMVSVTILLLVAAFNINEGQNDIALTNLALENIEALAQNESGESKCNPVGYKEVWSGGCLYYCARCANSSYHPLYVIRCLAR